MTAMKKKQVVKWVGLCFCAGLAISAFAMLGRLPYVNTDGGDWTLFFRPAALNLCDPYIITGAATYWPWFFVVLYPLALLPQNMGFGILATLSVVVLMAYTKEWWRCLLLCASMPVIAVLAHGQVDALLVVAFMLPPGWDLLAAAMKPQAIFCAILRRNMSKITWKVVVPVVVFLVMSFIIWGWWPSSLSVGHLHMEQRNLGWPYLVGLGVLLLMQKDIRWWLIGGLFLTPYLASYHLVPVLAYFYRRERWWVLILVTVATWIVAFIA